MFFLIKQKSLHISVDKVRLDEITQNVISKMQEIERKRRYSSKSYSHLSHNESSKNNILRAIVIDALIVNIPIMQILEKILIAVCEISRHAWLVDWRQEWKKFDVFV